MRTADILAHGRENNFNLIRICAAFSVIVSHSYALALGPEVAEPLEDVLPFTLGSLGVKVFFVVSGFLILKSFMRRRSTWAFGLARVLRIFPGLVVVSLAVAFVVGPALTTHHLGAYLTDPQTLSYVPKTVSLVWMEPYLPGLFLDHPYSNNVNGSLWTLPAEVECYIGLALAGLLGFYKQKRFPLLLIAFCPVYVVTRYGMLPGLDLASLASLALPFLLGMTAYFYRRYLPLDGRVLLGLTALAGISIALDILAEEFATALVGYGALYLGAADVPQLKSYNKIGDYSYGVYIYGWPSQQVIISLWPGVMPGELMVAAGAAALICGVLSWHLIENPALNWGRSRLSGRGVEELGRVPVTHHVDQPTLL